jgi:L-cysteine/cystine lyase
MGYDRKIDHIRRQMPATQNCIYFNIGWASPMPVPVDEAIRGQAQRELTLGRVGPAATAAREEAMVRARAAVARVIGASPEEIALTFSATEAMNIVVWGLDWQEGDELISTNLENPAGLMPLYMVRERKGVKLHLVDLHYGEVDAVEAIAAAITPRTHLIMFSEVTYSTGALLPVRRIVELAHENDILVLVDAAQSCGAIPVKVHENGADFYAISGHKWLCGPEGTGALYVRRDRWETIAPTYVGVYSDVQHGLGGGLNLQPNARRFEGSTRNYPNLVGQEAGILWLEGEVDFPWAMERIAGLMHRARQLLGDVKGLSILTPPEAGGLLSFAIAGIDAEDLDSKLAQQRIFTRWVDEPRCVRISLGFYNTEEELERLTEVLQASAGR